MNRRELLKFSLLTPLLSLFKKKETTPEEALADFCLPSLSPPEVKWFETTGTSGEGTMFFWKEQLHPLGEKHIDGAGRVWTYVKWQGQ